MILLKKQQRINRCGTKRHFFRVFGHYGVGFTNTKKKEKLSSRNNLKGSFSFDVKQDSVMMETESQHGIASPCYRNRLSVFRGRP